LYGDLSRSAPELYSTYMDNNGELKYKKMALVLIVDGTGQQHLQSSHRVRQLAEAEALGPRIAPAS
jgi:hypothetical protein